jgi:hypothetical protein
MFLWNSYYILFIHSLQVSIKHDDKLKEPFAQNTYVCHMFEAISTDIKLDLPGINSNNVYEIDRELLLL